MNANTKPKLEIQRMVVATTGHLTPGEAEALNDEGVENGCPLAAMDFPSYGWMFYTGDFRENIEREEWPGLYATLEAIEHTGAHWLRLDCDGDPIEGLPVYEW